MHRRFQDANRAVKADRRLCRYARHGIDRNYDAKYGVPRRRPAPG